MSPRSRGLVIGLGILAVAPTVWSLATLISAKDGPSQLWDYLWQPPGVSTTATVLIGVGALVMVGVAIREFSMAMRDPHVDRRWSQIVALLAALMAYLGLAYAVLTAPVIGANIGGGLLLLLGFTVVPAICVIATLTLMRILRSERQRNASVND